MALTVTATLGTSGANLGGGMGLIVLAVTGAKSAASQTGQTATQSSNLTDQLSITPKATGSRIFGATIGSGLATYTANANTTFLAAQFPTGSSGLFPGVFMRSTSTTTANTPVTIGTTNNAGVNELALCEILANGTLAIDSSSPAEVSGIGTTTVLTTAEFSPPTGSLLVALAVGNGATNSAATMAITDSRGLTWTNLASITVVQEAISAVFVADVLAPCGIAPFVAAGVI